MNMAFVASFKKKLSFGQGRIALWDKTIRWLLLAIVFLLPIFFLLPNSHPLEFNKVILFNTLVLITTVIFFLKSFIKREIRLIKTPLDWFILAFVIFYLISFIFSKNHYISLVGVSGYYSASIISVICFVLFFYLLINVIRRKEDVVWFIGALISSAVLIVIFNLFQVNGVYLLPGDVTQNASFNLATSSSYSLAVLVAVCLFIGFGLFLYLKKKWLVVLSGVFIVLSLSLLFLLNSETAFYTLALGLFIFLILITLKSKQLSNWWVVLPTVILTVIVLFIFVDTEKLTSVTSGESIILDQKTSAAISGKSFIKAPLWGSGPQTFTYDFAQYRPVEFNDSSWWNLRFIKASNEWFGLLATVGAGGALALLALGFWFLIRSVLVALNVEKVDEKWMLLVITAVAWFIVFLTSFFIPFNFTLYLLWWLLLGLGVRMLMSDSPEEKIYSLKKSSLKSSATIGGIILLVVGTGLVMFFGVKFWLADYYFIQAQEGIEEEQKFSIIESYLRKAVRYNPYESKYHLSLAQGYATQAQLEALKTGAEISAIQELTQKVISTLEEVKRVDPSNPVVYEQEALLYDGLRNLISNVDELSVEAYVKAVELEPTNPFSRLNLGRSRLLQAQGMLAITQEGQVSEQANQLIDRAIADFNQTKELKQDFVLAETNLAFAYEIKGEFNKALEQLESLLSRYPDNIDIYWQIALIYEKQGNIDQAVGQLETAQNIAPENTQIQEKLEQLKSRLESGEDNI